MFIRTISCLLGVLLLPCVSRAQRDTLFRFVSITYVGSRVSFADIGALNGQLNAAGYAPVDRSALVFGFNQAAHFSNRFVLLAAVQYGSSSAYTKSRFVNVLAGLQIGYEMLRTPWFRLWPSVGLAYAQSTVAASVAAPQATTFGSYLANTGASPHAVLYNRIGAAPIGLQVDFVPKSGNWFSLRVEHYVPFGTNWTQQDNRTGLTNGPSVNPVLYNVGLLVGYGLSRKR